MSKTHIIANKKQKVDEWICLIATPTGSRTAFFFVTHGFLSKSSKASWKPIIFLLSSSLRSTQTVKTPGCRADKRHTRSHDSLGGPLPSPPHKPTSPSPSKAGCQTLEWIPLQWECEPRGNAACSRREARIKIEWGRGGREGMETWCKRNLGGGSEELSNKIIYAWGRCRRGTDKITSSPDISTTKSTVNAYPIRSYSTVQTSTVCISESASFGVKYLKNNPSLLCVTFSAAAELQLCLAARLLLRSHTPVWFPFHVHMLGPRILQWLLCELKGQSRNNLIYSYRPIRSEASWTENR